MPKTTYLSQLIAAMYFGLSSYLEAPLDNYVGLFTVLPTDPADSGTEVSYTGYARQQITSDFQWVLSSYQGYGYLYWFANRDPLPFAKAPADLALTGVGIWDAASGGNLLYYGALDLTLYANTRPLIPAQSLVLEASYPTFAGPPQATIYGLSCNPFSGAYPNSWRVHALVAWPSDWGNLTPSLPADPAYGYAAYGNDTPDWANVGGEITNTAALTFPAATVDWPDVVGLLFTDDNNTPWWAATVDAAPTVRAGQTLRLPAGSIRFRDL